MHQVESFRTHLADILLLDGLWLRDLWKLVADKPWVVVELLLQRRRQLSADLLDAEELVDLRLTWEERVSIGYFSHDAANRPNVDWFTVHIAEQKLRCPVPPCGHVVGQPGLALFLVDGSRKTKVTEPQIVILGVDEKVFWLDISMDDVVSMAKLNCKT